MSGAQNGSRGSLVKTIFHVSIATKAKRTSFEIAPHDGWEKRREGGSDQERSSLANDELFCVLSLSESFERENLLPTHFSSRPALMLPTMQAQGA